MAGVTRTYRESAKVARPTSAAGFWWKDIKGRAKGIATAPKRLSSRELAERATGILGAGVLKPMAISKLLGSTAKSFLSMERAGSARNYLIGAIRKSTMPPLREIIRAPQRELSRVKDIRAVKSLPADTFGKYVTGEEGIQLNPYRSIPGTLFHELAHGRQFQGMTKSHAQELYATFKNALESHAEGVSRRARIGRLKISPREYDYIYGKELARVAKQPGLIDPDMLDFFMETLSR